MTDPVPTTAIRDALRVVEESFAVRVRVSAEVVTAEEEMNKRKHELRNKRLFSGSAFSHAESTAAVNAATEKVQALLAQRHAINSQWADSSRQVWNATSRAIDIGKTQVAPVLRSETGQPRARAQALAEAIAKVETDFPSTTLDRLSSVNDACFHAWEFEHFHYRTIMRAERVLAAVEKFLGHGIVLKPDSLPAASNQGAASVCHDFALERNYNALAVRTAMNRVCLDHARPEWWYFERGLWKSSNLVKGKPPREWRLANPSWADTAYGWEKLGVKFIHAKRARSKPAELVGGLLQNQMEKAPGYCGRNEREDCPEATKRAKLAVEGKREHPSKHFYSFEQWVEVLGGLIDSYNAQTQQGRILDGRSPDKAFEEFWPKNGAVRFDASCWHLCAHYVSERKVTDEGIRFKLGKDWFCYKDEALGPYRHQTVLVWFDPGNPQLICVTDLDQKNPFFVQRDSSVDFLAALDPDSPEAEHYRNEVAKQAGFNKHAQTVYRSVKSAFDRNYRGNIIPRPIAALGQEMLARKSEATQQQDDGNRLRDRILRHCRELEMSPDILSDFSEQTEQSLARRVRSKRERARTAQTE